MNVEPDLPHRIEQLIAERAWLRELAIRLAGDASGGADIEQDTVLAYLRRPPRHAAVRPWLAKVACNFARLSRRSSVRRHAREVAAARPEASSSTLEVVERLGVHLVVVEVLDGLDEPYRSTLVLRFYEGLRSAEIAHRLGLPAATVRSRVHRGLEKMRAELSGRLGNDQWQHALVPLMTVSAPAWTGGSALVAKLSGGIMLKSLGAVGAVILAAVYLWPDAPAERPRPVAAALPTPAETSGAGISPADTLPVGVATEGDPSPVTVERQPASTETAAPASDAPTARLSVSCFDEDGELVRPEVLFAEPVDQPVDQQVDQQVDPELGRRSAARPRAAIDAVGVAHIDRVELDLWLRITASFVDGRTLDHTLEGPTRADEHQEAMIVLTRGQTLLQARLVSVDGQPQRDAEVLARLYFPQEAIYMEHWDGGRIDLHRRSDARGRIRLPVKQRFDPGTVRRILFRVVAGPSPDLVRGGEGVFDLSRALEPGVCDLGDVVVRAEPVLAAGRVVEEDQTPVAAATVRLFAARPMQDGTTSWRPYYELDRDTAEDGSFAIPASVEAGGPVRLQVEKEGFVTQRSEPFVPGTAGLEIVLTRGGDLRGELLLDPGLPTHGFLVRATDAAGKRHKQAVGSEGLFRFGEIAAFPVQLTVQRYGKVFDTIDVETPGEPAVLDLRGAFRLLKLRFLEVDGAPVTDSMVNLQPAADLDALLVQEMVYDDGRIAIPVPANVDRFRLEGLDRRAVEIDWSPFEQDVTLLPALTVECHLEADLTFLAAQHTVHLQLRKVGAPDVMDRGGNLDAAGATSFTVTEPGNYEVILSHFIETGGISFGREVGSPLPAMIEVQDTSTPQRFSFVLPTAVLDALKERAEGAR